MNTTKPTPQSELEEGAKEARRIINERREHIRTPGALKSTEDATYKILRKYEEEKKNEVPNRKD